MSRRGFLGAGIALGACVQGDSISEAKVIGCVRRLSPKLDALIDMHAPVEQLKAGVHWAEGPVWLPREHCLLFTDMPGYTVYRWRGEAGVDLLLKSSGFGWRDLSHMREGGLNGMALDPQGRLLACDSGARCISRLDLAMRREAVLADRFEGKRFNSPNDLCVHSSGAVYFTDPPYGLEGGDASPAREIGFHGVYRLAPDGVVKVVAKDIAFPNGIALSPDERTLYVSSSDTVLPQIVAFTLGADGMPVSSRQFLDARPLTNSHDWASPDGMDVDERGNLFATGPGGVLVLSPEGELLGAISTGGAIANCKFGEDGRTLFLAADHKLARIRTKTRGAVRRRPDISA